MTQGYTKALPLDTDTTLTANSDLLACSQKAIKTYVDNKGVNIVTHASSAKTSIVDADEMPVVDSAASYALKKVLFSDLKKSMDSWVPDSNTWTYASADAPTYTFTVSGDVRSQFPKDTKVKFTQSVPLSNYWSFDSNSNDAIGGLNGTDTNVTYTTGKYGNAATFNGTTSKIVFTDTNLKATTEFTTGFIFKNNGSSIQGLLQCWSNNTFASGWVIYLNTAGQITCSIGNNTSTTGYVTILSNRGFYDGLPHRVVITYRRGYLQLYVDGNLEGTAWLGIAYAATNYARVGCLNSNGTDVYYFNGYIDDLFFINNYALDGEYIKQKYLSDTAQGSGAITVTKYGVVNTYPTYLNPNTTVSVYMGNDYTMTNSTISSPCYSYERYPRGFPVNPDKWTIYSKTYVSQSIVSPTANVWYNPGGVSIIVHPGTWDVSYEVIGWFNSSAGGTLIAITLSRLANDFDYNTDMMCSMYVGNTPTLLLPFSKRKVYEFFTKGQLWLLMMTRDLAIASLYFYADYPAGVARSPPILLKAVYQF